MESQYYGAHREISLEVKDWIPLFENGDQWKTVLNTVKSFGFHITRGIY
jgi:hypothetical protein